MHSLFSLLVKRAKINSGVLLALKSVSKTKYPLMRVEIKIHDTRRRCGRIDRQCNIWSAAKINNSRLCR